jgi:trimeric autotransporter adhesin
MEKTFTLSRYLLKIAFIPIILILFGNSAHAQATYYDNYAFRIPLTTNNASLGIATDQTNFVALLKVVSPSFVAGPCSNLTGGSASVPPFAIIDSAYSTTIELKYQIENWDPTTGTIYFWVRVPTLYKTGSVNGSNKFYCYFGSTGTPTVTHNTAWQKLTWSSVTATAGINYSGVYHFNEDPAGVAPQFSDATVNNNNLSVGSAGGVTQNTASQIGNGITLVATSVLDIGTTGMPNSNANQSLSLWASYPATPIHTANLIVLENSSNPALTGNGTQLGVLINGASTPLQTWRWANRLTPLVAYAIPPTANVWHHLVYTYDAAANKSYLYEDGVLVAGPTTDTANPPFAGTVDMVSFGDYINNNIGGTGLHTVGGQSYTGTMDEAHVIGATLLADWVKAEYVNQKNAATFTTAGAMQTNTVRASTVAGYLVYKWKGISTDITNPNNWDDLTTGTLNELPINSNVNWVIPSGLANYPVFTTSTGVYGVTINSGAYINLNGFTLSVGCNIYNSSGGQILYSNSNASKITWNGSISSQYYYGTNTALTAQVGAMEVNNSAAGTVNISGGPLDIFNLLMLTKGSLAVGAAPAALTLKSSSTQSANVAAIPAGSSITGIVNVERFIKGSYPIDLSKRGYRLLSSPVYSGTVGTTNVFDLSWLSNSAIVRGAAGGGFTSVGNPSIYIYREDILPSNADFTTGNYKGVGSINNAPIYNIGTQKRLTLTNSVDTIVNLPVGNGILFFFRGNKTNNGSTGGTKTTLPYNYPEDVTFTDAGTLNTGTVNVMLWFKSDNKLSYTNNNLANALVRGYCLVGNPYASTINWEKYNRNSTIANSSIYGGGGLPSNLYLFNPTNKQYEVYMQKTGTITLADTTTNVDPGIAVGSASNMIASGQGFFIRATSATQTLSFTETAKTTAQPATTKLNALMGKSKEFYVAQEPLLRLQLSKDSINTDEIVIGLNDSANSKFSVSEDAEDIGGLGADVSLSAISSDSVYLAISRLPFPKKSQQIIRLFTDAVTTGTYQLKLTQLSNLPPIYEVWLKDSFTQDSLDLRIQPNYSLTIDKSNQATFGDDRLKIVIRQNPHIALRFQDFDASKTRDGALVTWKAENESNYATFYVERSTDKGETFEPIGTVQSSGLRNYSFLDKNPATGQNQYRLKQNDINNDISYSKIVTLYYSLLNNKPASKVNVYPNPATAVINLTIDQDTKIAAYNIKITNVDGTVIKESISSQPDWHTNIGHLKPGTYLIQVTNDNNKSLVGITSFVKD